MGTVNPDGVAPSRMVGVSASVNLPLHHKVQKFSSGTGSPGWSRKKGRKTVVVVCGRTDEAFQCRTLTVGIKGNSVMLSNTDHCPVLAFLK